MYLLLHASEVIKTNSVQTCKMKTTIHKRGNFVNSRFLFPFSVEFLSMQVESLIFFIFLYGNVFPSTITIAFMHLTLQQAKKVLRLKQSLCFKLHIIHEKYQFVINLLVAPYSNVLILVFNLI